MQFVKLKHKNICKLAVFHQTYIIYICSSYAQALNDYQKDTIMVTNELVATASLLSWDQEIPSILDDLW